MKRLDRSLGLVSVIAISVSAMIGSGIFVLPGLATALTGPSAWLAYIIAACAVLPAALSKSELATAMPTSGGSYVFLDRAFGPLWGTVAGVALWLSLLLKSAFALVGMSAYLAVVTDVPGKPVAFGALAAIVVLNVLGVRKVSKALVLIATITVGALAFLVGDALFQLEPSHFEHSFPEGGIGLMAAAGLVFASFNGVSQIASIAEEVENPTRNLPGGIIASLALVTILYALVVIALIGVVPASELHQDIKPIHTLAHALGGESLGYAAGVLGVLTLASMANAGMLASSRYPFAMSRGKVVPSLFGRLHGRFATPIASIVLTGLAMAAVIAFLDVARIAKLASATVLLIYMAENFSVIVFRESRAGWYRPGWSAPLYPWTQILGVVLAGGLLVMLGYAAALGIALSVIPGLALYLLYGRTRTDRRGLISLLGRRDGLAGQRMSTPSQPVGEDEADEPAAAIVALVGEERSPEILAELGAALAEDGRTAVIDVQQMHEETIVDAAREDDWRALSLERRIEAAGDAIGGRVSYQVMLTRDPPGTIDRVTAHLHCRWLVMTWRTRKRLLLPYNPLGWMLDHIDANVALYRDAGVRYVREILVVSDGDESDELAVDTADHLALVWGATVTIAHWAPPGAPEGDVARAKRKLEQLSEACRAPTAVRVLVDVDEVSAYANDSVKFDLLVLTRQRTTQWYRLLRPSRHERIATAAACSVLMVQTPRRHP